MKKIILTVAVLAMTATASQAGERCGRKPLRTAIANAKTRVADRFASATARVVSLPSRIVEAAPVRTLIQTVSGCEGGRCLAK